jgi:hypothetical protein
MRFVVGLTLAVALGVAAAPSALRAESRAGAPWGEEQLLSHCAAAFVGEVLETTTFEKYNRTVPTRVRVLLSIKGNVPRGERTVLPKHPGKHAYFDEEFSRPGKGRLGVFFVGTREQPDLLVGYKQTPDGKR